MTALLLAAVLWIGLHVGIAGTSARAALVRRLGEGGFRGAFSIASAIAITLLVLAWRNAGTVPLWAVPPAIGWVLVAVMLPSFILFAGSLMARNPTSVGQNAALSAEPRGVLRITRHPMLWAFALWGAVHVIGNGDSASLVFFGAFLLTAALGMPSLDAKVAARDPSAWAGFASRTSLLPFGAVAAGRNRIAWRELALPALVGLVAWAAMLHFHPAIFGVSPIPR
ncbi:NnrU family protein [Muricoccus pecuniae]|uniref:Putative membrane protein n=1 Tax=Muricoccus pecuniae TaxID=693023 RepID=A0A840YGY0_9PROT|nr:NnrU family protein [Roseomonas pecuniae]MBB5693183.1 putative membrane protein [Roseomonas pecuniae]